MLAHIAGAPVEELLPFAYGLTGVGVVMHVAIRRLRHLRIQTRRQVSGAPSRPSTRD